jgi:tetratricopeptide (TPR) repeat protein
MLQGNKSLAIQAAEKAMSVSTREEVLFSAAIVYLDANKQSQARELAGQLSKQFYPEALAYAKLVGGELSFVRDDIPSAINLFQEAQSQVDTWLGHFLLGKAYLKGEAFTEAYSEFETCLKRQGEAASVFLNDLPSFRYLPPVYYYLGRAQEGLESDAASASYQKFLQIKQKGDGDWMVEDARQRLASN